MLEPIFTKKDAAVSILVTVLSIVTEMERELTRECQQAVIKAAKGKGVHRRRKATFPTDKAREMAAAGQGPSAIAKTLGISQMSVGRVLTAERAI